MLNVDALVAYANELEETTEGAGLAWLKARRGEALAKIDGGGTSDIISTLVNGEQFTRKITATALEWFDALQAAIADFNGKAAKVTYARIYCAPH